MLRTRRLFAGFLVSLTVALSLVAFAGPVFAQQRPTVAIQSPANGARVPSGTLTVRVASTGVRILAPDDTRDPTIGHYHLFVDQQPVLGTQPIPRNVPGILHFAADSVVVENLQPGQHTITLVLAHGDHVPFQPAVTASSTFTVVAGAAALPRTGSAAGLPLSTGGVAALVAAAGASAGAAALFGRRLWRRSRSRA